jgi:hypothetical protein
MRSSSNKASKSSDTSKSGHAKVDVKKKTVTNKKSHDHDTKSHRLVSDKSHHDVHQKTQTHLEKHVDSKHDNKSKHDTPKLAKAN